VQFEDRTYRWDAARGTLAETRAVMVPTDEYDRVVQSLEGAGYEQVR
jgi:hypothetical protein